MYKEIGFYFSFFWEIYKNFGKNALLIYNNKVNYS